MPHNQIISYLINHPEYFLKLISSYYPFTGEQLIKYKNTLNWSRISENRSIKWDEGILSLFQNRIYWGILTTNPSAFKDSSILDKFEDRIVWYGDDDVSGDSIAYNNGIRWDIETIDKYENKINIAKLSENTNVEWSDYLLDKYRDKWDFIELAHNESIPWTEDLFDKYLYESFLSYYGVNTNKTLVTFKFVERYHQFMSWHYISLMPSLPWKERDLLNYWRDKIVWTGIACNTFLFANDDGFLIRHIDKWLRIGEKVFGYFSGNESFPWSKKMIDIFKDILPWDVLCCNEGINWNIDLIDTFQDYIKWGGWIPIKQGEWTVEFGLIDNKSVQWSIELLQRFEHELEFEALLSNSAVWEKAYKPYVDDKMIDLVMRII